MIVLAAILGFLVGGFLTGRIWRNLWRRTVRPLRETEVNLRKELGMLRGELFDAKLQVSNFQTYMAFRAGFIPQSTPEIKHRAHSKVLFFPHPEDLLK